MNETPTPPPAPATVATALARRPDPDAAASEPRLRLLAALGELLGRKPSAEITVGDIVAQAHVSKRTFYEQFATKDACLMALFEHLADHTLALIAADYHPGEDTAQAIEGVTRAYLLHLQRQPVLVRALYIELMAVGAEGVAVRRRITQRFADFLIHQVDMARAQDPTKTPLPEPLATAAVGGANELILQAIEAGRADRLAELTPAVTTFLHTVLRQPIPSMRV